MTDGDDFNWASVLAAGAAVLSTAALILSLKDRIMSVFGRETKPLEASTEAVRRYSG